MNNYLFILYQKVVELFFWNIDQWKGSMKWIILQITSILGVLHTGFYYYMKASKHTSVSKLILTRCHASIRDERTEEIQTT